MNRYRWIHLVLMLAVLASVCWPLPSAAREAVPDGITQAVSGESALQRQSDENNLIRDFGYLGEEKGWLWFGPDLYFTDNGGQDWRVITPSGFRESLTNSVFFLNSREGWVFSLSAGEDGVEYRMFYTEDGGTSWQGRTLAFPQSADLPEYPAALSPYFLDSQHGWLVVKWPSGSAFSIGTLFRTQDGGTTWEEVSIPTGDPVFFATPRRGWLAGGPAGDEFYTTEDGGESWLPLSLTPDAQQYWLPAFSDAQHGITAVQTPEGVNLYATEDGGLHWQEQTLVPLTEEETPAVALASPDQWLVASSTENGRRLFSSRTLETNAPDWGVLAAAALTPSGDGWAFYLNQNCRTAGDIISCQEQQTLAATSKNGGSWTPITLPNGANQVSATSQSVFRLSPTGNGQVSIMQGQGFDRCGRIRNSDFRIWRNHSPYKAVGFYVGGSHVPSSCQRYSASSIAQISQIGWKFLPLWTGPQSHGWSHGCGSSCISNNTTTAYNQGVAEANAAINAAISLGLANSDGSGTVIYYDLEAYANTSTYRAAAKAFINGWTHRIHQKGSLAGVYTSSCGGHIADFASIANVPDAAWPAAWYTVQYDPHATTRNVVCVDNHLWANHQRIRQYAGDYDYNSKRFVPQTWGGVSLLIDGDVLDGPVVDLHAPDTTPPHTLLNLNGLSNNFPAWFDGPVEVHLHADDRGGRGVDAIYYRRDGGSWERDPGNDVTFTISGDGHHTLEYYAKDKAGNQETTHTAPPINIDTTPPSAPGAISEGHGIASGVWQSDINDPDFTWGAASDADSGVYYYRIEWGGASSFSANPSYDPPPVRTGSYTLTVRAVDRAGNVGPAGTIFVFNYDGSPPHAPDIQNQDGVASGVWQNQVRTPNFSWPTPHDEGSGVVGYYIYWGDDEDGTDNTLTTDTTFSSDTPICDADDAATYYLRVRSEDGVGLQSEWVGFSLRYDGAPPVANLVANYGLEVVHQAMVHLDINTSDLGSGVSGIRLSNEGQVWSDWMEPVDELEWKIPSVGQRHYDIYLQARDLAGNLSEIVSDTVYLDVNVPQPHSENYNLWDSAVVAGGRVSTSTNHLLNTTIQWHNAPAVVGQQYQLVGGFQAGAMAVPTQTVTVTRHYAGVSYLVSAGGTGAEPLQSAGYQLHGSLGQPSDMQVVTGTQYVATLGYWGGAAAWGELPGSGSGGTPPPPPPPSHDCDFYSISINDGALFTNRPEVALGLCGPDVDKIMLSNDGGFGGAVWQPYTRTISWTLSTYGNYVMPRYVYARFQDNEGNIHGNFFDDIIYDPNAPDNAVAFDPAALLADDTNRSTSVGSLQVVNSADAELFVSAIDDNSGLDEIQVSLTPDFTNAEWQPFSSILPVEFTEEGVQTVYVRTRDQAQNASEVVSANLVVDWTPPTATLRVAEGVVGPDVLSVTLLVTATDALGEVSAMRMATNPAMTDTIWITYTPVVTVYQGFTGELTPTVYVQLRDEAGNESPVYSTTYWVDVSPPWGTVEVESRGETTATLRFDVEDDLSGVSELLFSPEPWFFDDVTHLPYQPQLVWDFGNDSEVYVVFVDGVGNWSEPHWVALREAPPMTITKSVVPTGTVSYGRELTYTLVISTTPGESVRVYDPLIDLSFVRFIAPMTGVVYSDGIITGSLEVTPTTPVTLSFVARAGESGMQTLVQDVSNSACIYPAWSTSYNCVWSNAVINKATRSFVVYLPLVLRSR